MNINDTIGVGKKVLEAFILAKTGNIKRAGRLFAEAAVDESIDPLMDGLAKSIQSMESQDEEDVELTDEEPEDEEIESQGEEEVVEEDDEEEEVKDEKAEGVEIPASVAEVLKLEY